MSRRANVVRHGYNHACGGSDPIPGICDSVVSPDYFDVVTGDQYAACLLGYWRLGDAASPFLDSNPYLTHQSLTRVANTTALTAHVSGGLSANQDDGAVRFNGFGNPLAVPAGTPGDYLTLSSSRFNFSTIGSAYTVAVWIKPVTRSMSGYYNSPGVVNAMSSGLLNEQGWALEYDWLSQTVFFRRRQNGGSSVGTSAAAPLDAWSFIVGTYDGTQTSLYVNGALANTTVGSTAASGAGKIEVGRGALGPDYFYGSVDELAIFGCVLTPAQVAALYAAQTVPDSGDFTVYTNGS